MKRFARCMLVSLLMALGLTASPAGAADDGALVSSLRQLNEGSFDDKAAAVRTIAESGHPRAVPVLQALLDSRLYFRIGGGEIVIADSLDSGFAVTDPLSGERVGEASQYEIRRVSINNAVRTEARKMLALAGLSSPDRQARSEAVERLLESPDPAIAKRMEGLVAEEPVDAIRRDMSLVIGLARLDSPDAAIRLEALETLDGSLRNRVRNEVRRLAQNDPDSAVQARAAEILTGIEERRDLWGLGEQIFFGLSAGSVLMLAAFGLAITFGVMGVINMAHGELIMLGAYTTYVVQLLMPNAIDYSLFVAIPAAFLVTGAFGVAIERGVIRFLYGRPLETLLATFGISLILQQLVRTVFSPLNRQVSTPDWMSGAIEVNAALSLTLNRLYVIAFAFLVFGLLLLLFKRTTLGLKVRAVSQNRAMARAVGVSSSRIDALTFGLGAGVAGLAGVALSQITNVGPNMGQAYIIDSFLVVVFGGAGSLWGTLVGGLSLGVLNKFLEPETGAVLAKVLVLVFVILFIQRRPQGLFPQRGRAASEG
ncbi:MULTISPECIES: urea ABC transporter permease subunit UrtB [Spiribacter]|uniref:urea ABC transporter permease subunit UrtB n=1 Tax=Spiribacter TaxID=1335745 RepID=UPI00132F9166|nr:MULTISPECIES: urea ABC transporter permease subunit UrtB [Spiribacter]KAF0282222.1 urea ABC transporter permease subunit UrtB [Spiribacter roseus]KAF0284064.1 urea ABC transporter permease subunit UrtB [Spiribacter roseus]KAF0285543.1 urea ABC transporter permease subunit UrtB [Spiribacter sp. SSL99]